MLPTLSCFVLWNIIGALGSLIMYAFAFNRIKRCFFIIFFRFISAIKKETWDYILFFSLILTTSKHIENIQTVYCVVVQSHSFAIKHLRRARLIMFHDKFLLLSIENQHEMIGAVLLPILTGSIFLALNWI